MPHLPNPNATAVSPEYTGEYDLFRRRLHLVEEQAGRGEHGTPVEFLAGLEVEFGFIEINQGTNLDFLRQRPDARERLEAVGAVLPANLDSLVIPGPEERREKLEKLRQEARSMVGGLVAGNEGESAKKQQWLKDVDGFTTEDLLNFALYREFSVPTLGETAPPKGASRREMLRYADATGWLEFRFGTGQLQEGYYDNPGICELRLSPCPPSELIEREEILVERMSSLALEYGALFTRGGNHINLSAYTSQRKDGVMEDLPAIGFQPERRGATLGAVAGVSLALQEGAWITEDKARDRFLFHEATRNFQITPFRDTVRIQDDYMELRDRATFNSTAHGLLWMVSGVSYGLGRGVDAIAEAGKEIPSAERATIPVRTERFDKEKDLQLLRMLEQAVQADVGGFVPDADHIAKRGVQFAESFIGEEVDLGAADSLAYMVLFSIDVVEGGRLDIRPEIFQEVYEDVFDEAHRDGLEPLVKRIGLDGIFQKVKALIDHDAIRMQKTETIRAKAPFTGQEPDAWRQGWQNSDIIRLAYGEKTLAYAKHLGNVAVEHYVPIDRDDPESVRAALLELLERREREAGRYTKAS